MLKLSIVAKDQEKKQSKIRHLYLVYAFVATMPFFALNPVLLISLFISLLNGETFVQYRHLWDDADYLGCSDICMR